MSVKVTCRVHGEQALAACFIEIQVGPEVRAVNYCPVLGCKELMDRQVDLAMAHLLLDAGAVAAFDCPGHSPVPVRFSRIIVELSSFPALCQAFILCPVCREVKAFITSLPHASWLVSHGASLVQWEIDSELLQHDRPGRLDEDELISFGFDIECEPYPADRARAELAC